MGLRRIATEQIVNALCDIVDDEVPLLQKIQSVRVRCKKLRGLLRLTQPLMGHVFRIEDQYLRVAARQLTDNRDVEVRRRAIEALGGAPVEAPQQVVSHASLRRSQAVLRRMLDNVEGWPYTVAGFHDIAPASAAGLDTVWINRPTIDATRPVEAEPTWTFESLADFTAALR